MHFLAPLTLALTLATAALAGKPVDQDFYTANYAAIQTERLNTYASSHRLSAKQQAAIGAALELVKSQNHGQMAAVREAVEEAFGKDAALFLLTGRDATSSNDSNESRRTLLRRARDCNCSTDDNYCNDSKYCKYNHNDCEFNAGCGTLWLEECDGMCVKKS